MVQTKVKPNLGWVFQAGLTAAALSTVVNAVIYLIASSMGFFPSSVLTPAGQPFSLAPVIIVSVVASLGAALVYALLVRFVGNPNRIFLWIAAAVFVLMFFNPFMLKGAPAGMLASLEIMHVVVAGSALYLLTLEPIRKLSAISHQSGKAGRSAREEIKGFWLSAMSYQLFC